MRMAGRGRISLRTKFIHRYRAYGFKTCINKLRAAAALDHTEVAMLIVQVVSGILPRRLLAIGNPDTGIAFRNVQTMDIFW